MNDIKEIIKYVTDHGCEVNFRPRYGTGTKSKTRYTLMNISVGFNDLVTLYFNEDEQKWLQWSNNERYIFPGDFDFDFKVFVIKQIKDNPSEKFNEIMEQKIKELDILEDKTIVIREVKKT